MIATIAGSGGRRVPAPVAGVASQLGIATQPAGAATGVALTQQPVIEIRDSNGDKIGTATTQVTVAKASGSGTLSGTTTVNASSGSATFTDLVITGTGEHTLVFTATGLAGTTSGGFTVSGAPPPSALVFASDWSTATGMTDAALRDTGQVVPWDIQAGNGDLNQAVAATGLGFPATMTNVLECNMEYNGSGAGYTQHVRLTTAGAHIPIPDVGEDIFYRAYIRIDVPDTYTADDNTHPFQDAQGISEANWALRVTTLTNGTWVPMIKPNQNTTSWPNTLFACPPVNKGDVHRFEVHVHRNAETTIQIHVRVYDTDDSTLLYDDADFSNLNSSATLASNPSFTIFSAAEFAGFNGGGHNGVVGGTADQFPFLYGHQGGVAISVTDWCGAYVAGESP